jgi:nicotinate-nucleotide pyrophosphorylase (carboxylating)
MSSSESKLDLLLPLKWKKCVASWIEEDCPSFDVGGYVVGNEETSATLFMKSDGVIAGVPFFDEVFRLLSCRVEWSFPEGSVLSLPSDSDRIEVGKVFGKANLLLLGERTGSNIIISSFLALNIIARASGIATRANRLQKLKKEHEWKGIIAGTRKTTPGFRIVEKYAMLVGGCDNHRYDLSSMIMLKVRRRTFLTL